MKTLTIYVVVLAMAAITTATGCKKNDGEVKPVVIKKNVTWAAPQDSTLSGGQDDPTPPPHHP